jgi:hypothetical protein
MMAKDEQVITSEDIATLPKEGREISLSREKLRGRLARDLLANSDAMEKIGDEIATAETVDDILSAGGVVHAEDFLNIAMDVRGFVLRPSDEKFVVESDGQSESFAVMDIVVVDAFARGYAAGDVLLLTCGGYNVQNALIRYAELSGESEAGLFAHPLRCALKEAGRALRLYKPDSEVIAEQFRVIDA